MHLNVLNKWIRVFLEIACQAVLPCLEALTLDIVDKLMLDEFTEFKVVPFFILWIEYLNLVFYLELEVFWEILKGLPKRSLV